MIHTSSIPSYIIRGYYPDIHTLILENKQQEVGSYAISNYHPLEIIPREGLFHRAGLILYRHKLTLLVIDKILYHVYILDENYDTIQKAVFFEVELYGRFSSYIDDIIKLYGKGD